MIQRIFLTLLLLSSFPLPLQAATTSQKVALEHSVELIASLGLNLSRDLLLGEKHRATSPSEKLRIRHNVRMIAQFMKVYQYYFGQLASIAPKQASIFQTWNKKASNIQTIANQFSRQILMGAFSSETLKKLQKIDLAHQPHFPSLPNNKKNKDLLLETIGAFGSANEVLFYFTLCRTIKKYSTSKKYSAQKKLKAFQSLFQNILKHHHVFSKLKKYDSRQFALFVYHSALLIRNVGLQIKMCQAKDPKARQQLQKRYLKRKKQLTTSLKKYVRGFSKIWRCAP